MKKTTNLLLASIIAVLFCLTGNAQQIIYSNSFSGGAAAINGTAPTVANSGFGGTNTALWIYTFSNAVSGYANTANDTVLANGTLGTNAGSAVLPFKPQSGAVYYLTGSVYLPGANSWIGMGFCQSATIGTSAGSERFTDGNVKGGPWMDVEEHANINLFGGPETGDGTAAQDVEPTVGTYTLTIMLNTLGTNWVAAAYVNSTIQGTNFVGGVQLGTNITYLGSGVSNPTIGYMGMTQQAISASDAVQWNYITLSTAAEPLISQQPVTASANAASAFTNTISAVANTNGGPLLYQWFFNSSSNYAGASALTNTADGRVFGTAANSLVITNLHASDAGFYYVVVTNNYGSITSTIAQLTVYAAPSFVAQLPATYTSPLTLYAGANPQFSVAALGKLPIYYQWYTNNVACRSQTNVSFIWSNVPISAINAYCVATNSVGSATSAVWTVSAIADPTAPFPANALALNPIGYWPLNEAEVGGGDDGVVAIDYAGGNDGAYTNVGLGLGGYSGTDPNAASPIFGAVASTDSGVFAIQGINFGAPSNTSATFTVQAWVNSPGGSVNGAGIVSEGYQGTEQFALGIASGDYQFLVHDASGNSYSATAGFGPDGNWHFLAGVCDEVNGAVSLYVDSELAASVPIASGSGLLASANSMTIGARSSTPAANYDLQFYGYIDEVSVFNYALSYAQVAALEESVGGTLPAYIVPPAPLANFPYQAGTTLTIPAMVSGQPPFGYYWTNLTTATVLGAGASSALGYLNATLSIPDASTNWSGDQLQLVVTNAFNSVTSPVTLFAYPSPVAVSATNPIIYSNNFDAGTVTVSGTAPTVANFLVGGTNAVWVCTYTNTPVSSNGTVYGNGTLGTNAGCALLPFTPEPGYVYTMTGSLVSPSAMGDWVAMGFAQAATPINNADDARFTDNDAPGYAWMYVQNANGVFEPGPRTTAAGGSTNTLPIPSATPVTMQVVLNTITNNGWTASAFVNGTQFGSNYVYTTTPSIAYAGVGQNSFSSTTSGIQWQYWTLTAQAVSVPAYLIAPLPPTNVTVSAGATLTIPATVLGTPPFGYYWSNTNAATVIGSGATTSINNPSTLDATLTVPSVPSSWNGDQLELTVTNAYGTNTTLVALSVSVNTNLPPIVPAVTNGQLTLSWPSYANGYTLQAQTNSLGTNWVDVAGSSSSNVIAIPINPTNGSVFYRLIYR
jgi:hypothetical protein